MEEAVQNIRSWKLWKQWEMRGWKRTRKERTSDTCCSHRSHGMLNPERVRERGKKSSNPKRYHPCIVEDA